MATKHLIDTSIAIKYLNQTHSINGIAFIDAFINMLRHPGGGLESRGQRR